jgi:hypothetical protein
MIEFPISFFCDPHLLVGLGIVHNFNFTFNTVDIREIDKLNEIADGLTGIHEILCGKKIGTTSKLAIFDFFKFFAKEFSGVILPADYEYRIYCETLLFAEQATLEILH